LSKPTFKTCTCSSSVNAWLVDSVAMITMRSHIYIWTELLSCRKCKAIATWTESFFISQ
jgi:hypothetical protein